MAPSQLPSWLTPVSGRPGFYYHRGLNQCVPIEDEEVQQRYYEEQYDIQRRRAPRAGFTNFAAAPVHASTWSTQSRAGSVQSSTWPAQASTWPVQPTAGPVIVAPNNFGHVNYSPVNMEIYQSSTLGHNFVGHHHASQQQAPLAPLNNTQAVFGSFNHQYIHQPQVQQTRPAPQARPPPVPASAPAQAPTFTATAAATVVIPETIDLTGEDSPPGSIEEPIDLADETPVNTPPEVLQVPETPRAKPDATFWIKGLAYLVRRLGSYGGSDRWRLFESMRSYPRKEKRHRYCERYWPTEEAAWDDITAKSRWFLDAEELFTYDLKWSRLETLANFESPSEGEIKEKVELEALVLADKNRLAEALKGKRETKIEQEDLAQSFNRLQTSKRAAFAKSTGMPKSIDNIKRAQKNLEEERLKQKTARQNGTTGKGKERARTTKKSSPKKRKAIVCEIRGGSPAKRSRSEEGQLSPTEEASPTVPHESTPESDDDIDAEGETDDETPVTATNEEGDWEWDLEEVAKQLLEDDQPLPEPGSSISENVEAEMEDDAAEGDKEGSKYGEDMNEDFWESSEEEIVYSDLTVVYPV